MQEWLVLYQKYSMQEWLVLYQKYSMQEWLVLYGSMAYRSGSFYTEVYGMQEWLVPHSGSFSLSEVYGMQQWLVAGRHLYQTATSINVQECPQQELSSLWVMPLSRRVQEWLRLTRPLLAGDNEVFVGGLWVPCLPLAVFVVRAV